ncbi:hypothetical protein VMCG_09912 [Cytospora schulzeri]|uniref:Uncharacterized protein n=1 Tax=Cytospora schulzeri TaxID=448051 RepID=A0A423VDX1_9PEZI|nr:hypothetical protein VMCG_09912 [Valsa malicola]
MPPSTARKRAKKLLKELWELQTNDVPMTASTLLETKYLLQSSKRCIHVEVISPRFLADLPASQVEITDDRIPEFIPTSQFIRCQLEDQKLTGSRSHNCQQDPVALPAVLALLNRVCSTASSARKCSYPTQFRWHCSLTHRTHIIFSFVDVKMRSRVYTIGELLNLRSSASSDVVAAMNYQENELVDMVRNKPRGNSVSSRSYNSSSLKRDRKKTVDTSSTTSDEVVFKGTMNRRPVVKQEPTPVNNENDSTATKAPAVPVSESDQHMEWKYRGRSGSEITSNEPLPAPTGLNAQQNEGFQRFYKAVVSPTHVRVTAGGRIVPNTRNPVSPTAKRPKDDESVSGEKTEAAPSAAPKQPPPVMGMPHPMPYFYPGFPGMPPVHPMTGMPMPMMPPGFPYPIPMPPVPTSSGAPEKENQSKKTEDSKAGPESDSGQSGIKLSPPEQFDRTKPFVYNGQQWMFPMFPAQYPGFLGMPPPGYASTMPGPHMMMPPHLTMAPMMGPMGPMGPVAPQAPSAAATNPTAPASSRQTTPQPPPKPPISSIRPSQITRKQIDGLRANLKYHEDQLQYNKHQIDESDMETKIQMLNADIERFEKVFRAQVEYEGKHYPKSEKARDEESSSSGRSSAPSSKAQSQSEESKDSKATTVSNASHPQPKLRKKERSRDSVGLNSNKSSTASYAFDETTSARERAFSAMNPARKTTLPSGAALAPVFQPRSVSTFSCPVSNGQGQGQVWPSAKNEGAISQEQLEAAEKRLLAAGAKAWNHPQEINGTSDQSSRGVSPRNQENLGVPYLVGTLPRGINTYAGHRIEYDYNRKLTAEEVQARHLYWGKAPRSVSHGLPKYDGKNFYPPSPAKNITPSESPSIRRSRVPIGVPEIDYSFSAPNGKDIDPFRAATPNEPLLKAEGIDANSKAPSVRSAQSFSSQADNHSEEFEKALAESKTVEEIESSRDSQSRASLSETKSADYHDARSNGASSKLWQSMLKRGLTNSDVLPSAVTSTTAHGLLPQFIGHATASLSPTISGTVGSPSRGSPAKEPEANSTGTSTFMAPKTGENAPPAPSDRTSISDTLRSMVGMKP